MPNTSVLNPKNALRLQQRDSRRVTKGYDRIYSDQSSRRDQKKRLPVPPTDPSQDKVSQDFGRNFNGTVYELREVDTDAEA